MPELRMGVHHQTIEWRITPLSVLTTGLHNSEESSCVLSIIQGIENGELAGTEFNKVKSWKSCVPEQSQVRSDMIRRNRLKLHQGSFGLDMRKNSFTEKVVKYWSTLPRGVVGVTFHGEI